MAFALVFPGQGSQSVGMMDGYGDSSVIRDTFAEASAALGEDLWEMVSNGPAERLALTVNTQPLMLTAGVAAYRAWLAAGGATPAIVAWTPECSTQYHSAIASSTNGQARAMRNLPSVISTARIAAAPVSQASLICAV